MPKLNDYIKIGFCAGYGDGDFEVSMAVQDLSKEQVHELIVTCFHAQRTLWDIWCRGQASEKTGIAL